MTQTIAKKSSMVGKEQGDHVRFTHGAFIK